MGDALQERNVLPVSVGAGSRSAGSLSLLLSLVAFVVGAGCSRCPSHAPPVEPATALEAPRVIVPDGPMLSCRFSRDGGRIAGAVFEKQPYSSWMGVRPPLPKAVVVWDVKSARVVASVPLDGRKGTIVDFDGDVIALAGWDLHAARLSFHRLDLSTGHWEDKEGPSTPAGTGVAAFHLAADGGTLLAVVWTHKGMLAEMGANLLLRSANRAVLLRWDLLRDESSWVDLGQYDRTDVAFSADGTRLAAGTMLDRGAVWRDPRVWDTADGRLLAEVNVATDDVRIAGDEHGAWQRVALSPDGSTLARYFPAEVWRCRGDEREVFRFRLSDVTAAGGGATFRDIPRLAWQSDALAFSPDGRRLASPRHPAGVSVWDVATGRLVTTLAAPDDLPPGQARRDDLVPSPIDLYDKVALPAVFYAPDGRTIATWVNGVVHLWPAPH